MTLKSSEYQYGLVAVTIHWISAVLILILIDTGLSSASNDVAEAKVLFLRIHIPVGILLLFLTIIRIVWWVKFDAKPRSISMPTWQLHISRGTHFLLYLTIIGLSSSGLGIVFLSGAGPFIFGGLDLALFPDFWAYLPRTPHYIVSRILIVLLIFHVVAALYHHFVLKDRLLKRIWFRTHMEDK